MKSIAYWWSQNESNGYDAYTKVNVQDNPRLSGSSKSKKNGASIRCLKN